MEEKIDSSRIDIEKKKTAKRHWNLAMLGIASVAVAATTTIVSLLIYHNSGDIYLDRSRPGYLPDEEEIENNDDQKMEYVLNKNGKMDMETLEEYLKNLDIEIKAIDAYDKPFAAEALSNERLGIPAE